MSSTFVIHICVFIPFFEQNFSFDLIQDHLRNFCAYGASPAMGFVLDSNIKVEEQDLPSTVFPFAEFSKILAEWDPNDIVIPLFFDDAFTLQALHIGVNLLKNADRARLRSTVSQRDGGMLLFFRVSALAGLDFKPSASCIELADTFSDCCSKGCLAEDSCDDEIRSLFCLGACEAFHSFEKRRVWAFCSGQYSNDFRGNPKYLYLYVWQNRRDIAPYWLCQNEALLAQIRRMGLPAYQIDSVQASLAAGRTGLLATEFVKEVIPAGLENAIYLNLWHGVGGVKNVERSLVEGCLAQELAKKYIQHNAFFHENELYLSPSPFIDGIARDQLGLKDAQIIHAGYPRNIYQQICPAVSTFDHGCFRHPDLPEDVRFAAYIPTYRFNPTGDFFSAAIPDMAQLEEACKRNHICLIFKMHPLLENELGFKVAKETWSRSPWLYFWNNMDDFYEVIEEMDLCIFDYSSMFTDFVATGCRHFLRYTFDFCESDLNFPLGYDTVTLGRKCRNFGELLEALGSYGSDALEADITRVKKLFWAYATPDAMDQIIDFVLNFEPLHYERRTLYSFDIFDTLISRKCLAPEGVFYQVRERMREHGGFPVYLVQNYPAVRKNAELNIREYYNRSKVERGDERCEIQFDEIIARIQCMYGLDEEQAALLIQWEKESELANVIPLERQLTRVKNLLANKETIILVSDMYLPVGFIRQMLAKADPVLAELPLFLSSELGWQKSAGTLYMEVYRRYAPDWPFSRWVHMGDNAFSDIKKARRLNIDAFAVPRLEFNAFETALAERLQSYDGYLVAAVMARFRKAHPSLTEQFVYAYIALLFVPYIRWALHSCRDQGYRNVYLISRDGHQLTQIANVVNRADRLGLRIKYIYASRRVWRIPSFFDHIDVGFWGQGYGNLAHVKRLSKLIKALAMDEPTFRSMFPELRWLQEDTEIDEKEIVRLAGIFKKSKKLKKYLLEKAQEERIATCGYLRQEIDASAPFAIVEYWGRGYTQENFTRLWQHITGKREPSVFYYSRSTLPSDTDNIRMNFTTHPSSQKFIEAIFACINYKSVEDYRLEGGKWLPVTEEIPCDLFLFQSMERYLPQFTKEYCSLPLVDADTTGRALMDFALDWYALHPEWEAFTQVLGNLVDSTDVYGDKTVFAKKLTVADLQSIDEGLRRNNISKNIAISYHRAVPSVQKKFLEMFNIAEGDPVTSGRKISPGKIMKNALAREELEMRRQQQENLQIEYDKSVKSGSLERTILVAAKDSFAEEVYGSLFAELSKLDGWHVKKCSITQYCDTDFIRECATANVIFALDPLSPLAGITLRSDTKLVVLGGTAAQLFRSGLLAKEKLKDVAELKRFNLRCDTAVVQVASAILAERACDMFSLRKDGKILTSGCCVTDAYFNEALRAKVRGKVCEIWPESIGKKIICYIPYYRLQGSAAGVASMLDLEQMQGALGSEYFVLLHLQKNRTEIANTVEIQGFSANATDVLSMRSLMLAADVIIGDYRDTTFEAPLAGVPVFVTCWDKTNINKRNNIFCPFEEMMFGVPVDNTEDLIGKLDHIESYDDANCRFFREKYLAACDGRSAERLVSEMTSECRSAVVLPGIGELKMENVHDQERVLLERCLAGYETRQAEGHAESENAATEPIPESDLAQTGQNSDDLSADDGIAPAAAPVVRHAIYTNDGILLCWKPDALAAAWRVRCRYANGTQREVLLKGATTEWTDTDIRTDLLAQYSLAALCVHEDGSLSTGIPSEFFSASLAIPSELTVKAFVKGNQLKWKPVPGADKYQVKRKDWKKEKVVATIPANQTEWLDKNPPLKASYKIEAVHDYGSAIQHSGYGETVQTKLSFFRTFSRLLRKLKV